MLLNHLLHFRPFIFALISLLKMFKVYIILNLRYNSYLKGHLSRVLNGITTLKINDILYPFSQRRSIQVIHMIFFFFMITDLEKLS